MAVSAKPDPVRETLLEILRQLNQAETRNEGVAIEQALELNEIETRLAKSRNGDTGAISVSLAVGLLLRNGLVKAGNATDYSWQRQRGVRQRYQITSEGKKFLVEAVENSSRVR
jgi:hypothetical protein